MPLSISIPSAVACQMQPHLFEYSSMPFIIFLHHHHYWSPQTHSFHVIIAIIAVICRQLVYSPCPCWPQQRCSFPLLLFVVTHSSLLISISHCKLVPSPHCITDIWDPPPFSALPPSPPSYSLWNMITNHKGISLEIWDQFVGSDVLSITF